MGGWSKNGGNPSQSNFGATNDVQQKSKICKTVCKTASRGCSKNPRRTPVNYLSCKYKAANSLPET